MKTLYFECAMGASGDMIIGSLASLLGTDKAEKELNSLGLSGIEYQLISGEKGGVPCVFARVLVHGEEENEYHSCSRQLEDVEDIIDSCTADDDIKLKAKQIYKMIAAAEGAVHGKEPRLVHFHEVGALDAVADIMGACLLMKKTDAEKIIYSPVNVGSGYVECAHGVLPVPAPATAEILKGRMIYSDDENGELCTPTGAALLAYFGVQKRNVPEMVIKGIGTGAGKKDFNKPNILRCFLGECENFTDNRILQLACNIDDMTPEEITFAKDIFIENGALDASVKSAEMKKGRLGFELTVLCRPEEAEKFAHLIFRHTSTIGIRIENEKRFILEREIYEKETKFGMVRIKKSFGYGVCREKVEFEDASRLAKRHNLTLLEIKNELMQ